MSEQAAHQRKPIKSHFAGGTDFDNDIAVSGLTFEEAMRVVNLLGDIVTTRRREGRAATGMEAEGRNAQQSGAEHDSPAHAVGTP